MRQYVMARLSSAPGCPKGDAVPPRGWKGWSASKMATWLSDKEISHLAASTLRKHYNKDQLSNMIAKAIEEGSLERELCLRVRRMISEGDGHGNINSNRLVILNMGLGRDSMTMLGLLKEGRLIAEGHRVRPEDVDAIVFSDPGAEWDHSMRLTGTVDAAARQLGIPFYWLKKPLECDWRKYHSDLRKLRKNDPTVKKLSGTAKANLRNWRLGKADLSIPTKAETGYYHYAAPIIEDYRFDRPSGPMLPGYTEKACTVNHKIEPIRRLMDDLSVAKFGKTKREWAELVRCGKAVPHLNLVGITWDEHSDNPDTRDARNSQRHPYNPNRDAKAGPFWVDEAYPLAEMRIPKSAEQPILEAHGWGHVRKSGCFMCPYQPVEWYWLLHHKAQEGQPWARASYHRIRTAERDRFFDGVRKRKAGRTTRDKEGKKRAFPIHVVINDKRVQAYGRPLVKNKAGKMTVDPRKGEDKLLLPQAIEAIEKIYIEPRIQAYTDQGWSRKAALKQVIEEILLKDYAQGCKSGSTNRQRGYARKGFAQWSRCCPRHG